MSSVEPVEESMKYVCRNKQKYSQDKRQQFSSPAGFKGKKVNLLQCWVVPGRFSMDRVQPLWTRVTA